VKRVGAFVVKYAIALVLVAFAIILSIVAPNFLTLGNFQNILLQVSVNGLLAIGATLTILTAGIDLSVGSLVAVTGIAAALVAQQSGVSRFGESLVVGSAAGLALGAVNGAFVAFARIPPFVVTLGMMSIARSIAYVLSQGQPISNLSNAFLALGQGAFLGVPYPVAITGIAFVCFAVVLTRTRFGRYVYAVGGNEEAATVSGVDTKVVKLSVYALSGLLAGIAGCVLASRATAGLPSNGQGYELTAIAAAVIGGTSLSGGRGTLLGTLAGVLILGIMSNGLDLLNVSPFYQGMIQGAIIIGAVAIDGFVNRNS